MDNRTTPETASIHEWLTWAIQTLDGGESPNVDARVLLAHCMNKNTTFLMTWPEQQVDKFVAQQFVDVIKQRTIGTPVAYLLGYRDFWSLRLAVSEHTLIPRPESELVVETILALDLPKHANVLDLGTGTGAIALSLATENKHWKVTGVDIVDEAVELAKRNAQSHQITNANFYQSSWFEKVQTTRFDMIVSNPPYVENNSKYLAQGDVRFEPLSALTSGEDGLDDIRYIAGQAPAYLVTGGYLVFEHGFNQADAIHSLLSHLGYCDIHLVKDLNGLPRATLARVK